jgi:hypothetical protein
VKQFFPFLLAQQFLSMIPVMSKALGEGKQSENNLVISQIKNVTKICFIASALNINLISFHTYVGLVCILRKVNETNYP